MARFVLDSDTLTYIMQRRDDVLRRFEEAVRSRAQIYLCPMVYYEVRRGLVHKGAKGQLRRLESLARQIVWADFRRPMWEKAAHTWATVRSRGRPHDDDADLLIASYTLHLRAILVTNNTADFRDLGVPLTNWVG